MNIVFLFWRYLRSCPLAAGLNLLLTLGLASIMLLLLVSHQINAAFEGDLPSIDVVVGAKGSPMQLIFSGVFHLNAPTANEPLAAIKALQIHPQVAQIISINLSDTFRGFRIMGTTPNYITHYQVPLVVGARFLVLNDDSFGLDYRMTDATTVR